jgi:PIN domain nuclease of toxin-antitoxin system
VRVLLDTHVWLWMQSEPERIGSALDILSDSRNELLLSAACSWEIAIKYGLGRLALPQPPDRYVPERLRLSGTTAIAVEHAHTFAVASLPSVHRDPFDRLLVAQSRLLDAPILSADRIFERYEVDVIRAG